ncbi:MAG TPA: hypothetical protein VNZ03_25045 [Terriglobales bacterium]|nr:hypothetical protein [Terriglobales bacterium]
MNTIPARESRGINPASGTDQSASDRNKNGDPERQESNLHTRELAETLVGLENFPATLSVLFPLSYAKVVMYMKAQKPVERK